MYFLQNHGRLSAYDNAGSYYRSNNFDAGGEPITSSLSGINLHEHTDDEVAALAFDNSPGNDTPSTSHVGIGSIERAGHDHTPNEAHHVTHYGNVRTKEQDLGGLPSSSQISSHRTPTASGHHQYYQHYDY